MSSTATATRESASTDDVKRFKVVIAHQDEITSSILSDHLTVDGFNPIVTGSLEEAVDLCKYQDTVLLLLDLRLGSSDNQCADAIRSIRDTESKLRRTTPPIGIITISGRGTERERILAAEATADDHVVTPFSYGELMARMNEIMRQRQVEGTNPIVIGDVSIDRITKQVTVGEREVRLSEKEFALLLALAEEPTKATSKESILQTVWGYRSIGHTRTLDAHANRLRRKLDPDGSRHLIQSMWGVAYAFTWPVKDHEAKS